jgi:TRAP-type mannitol/chloroaromatic compound transport system substrate-binding protein
MKPLLRQGGVVAAIALVLGLATAPAAAQDKKVRVQMGWAFPSTTGLLGPTQTRLVETLRTISGGSIDVKGFEPGALVPANQYLDAVGNGSLDMAWTVAGFWTGKDIAFAMYGSVPFGPDVGEYLAWMKFGGGEKMMKELHAKYNVEVIPCGVISPEASGWFRKEIKTLDDLKGLKMRFFGLGANVMQKMGVSTQLLQAGEIFQALQLGTIDATEFSMPVLDQKQGFYQVAKYYYFPGWHQQASMFHLFVAKAKWDALSDTHKAILEVTCGDMIREVAAQSEATQFKAMREMQDKNGVKILYWSPEIMKAYEKAWAEVVAEESGKNPNFRKVWDSYSKFRADYDIWRQHGYLKN